MDSRFCKRFVESIPAAGDVLAGAGTPEMERQVHALGMTEFVEKEFLLHRLGDVLKRLIKTPISMP
jgi:hypothetical protein